MFSWTRQLTDTLTIVGEEQMMDNLDPVLWTRRKETILSKYRRHLALVDRERYYRSKACQVILPSPLFEIMPEIANKIPQHLIKPIVQIRLASNYSCIISVGSEIILLSPLKACVFCCSGDKESILHFLVQCAAYSNLRNLFWKNEIASGSNYEILGKMIGLMDKSPPDSNKKLGRPPKHLSLTRERAGSVGDIRAYAKRKRADESEEGLDSNSAASEDSLQLKKKISNTAAWTTKTINSPHVEMDLSLPNNAIISVIEKLNQQMTEMRKESTANTERLEL
ncbi:hypothetical protein KQX54_012366 [Cotesia glomerata]|uniref:Uncharacterized protein n=1 Tax=Cotesia glomerata TaxID=32391 RepID=A0AAV7I727_COTGL|nr:hypothetical protein KQX54_012366 [Cotesia glomerata]